jgi:primosomal protein N'
LRGAVGEGTTVSDLVRADPWAAAQDANTWRLLLRSSDLVSVAEAGARIARQASKERLRVRVEVDPEEV